MQEFDDEQEFEQEMEQHAEQEDPGAAGGDTPPGEEQQAGESPESQDTPPGEGSTEGEPEDDTAAILAEFQTPDQLAESYVQRHREHTALRQRLEAAGVSFGEDGQIVLPSPAAAAPVTPAPAAPVAPAVVPTVAVPAVPDLPAIGDEWEWDNASWAVAKDGSGLYEEAFEDPESEAADNVRLALAEQFGEARADTEYNRLVTRYEHARQAFRGHLDTREYTHDIARVTAGAQSFRTQIQTVQAKVHNEWLDTLPTEHRTEIYTHYHGVASQYIDSQRAARITQLTQQGMAPQRAQARADAEMLSDPDLYETALGTAVLGDLQGFVQRLVTSLQAGGAVVVPSPAPAVAPAAAAVPPVQQQTRPTPPPGMGAARGAGAGAAPGRAGVPGARGPVTPTAEETAVAQALGRDPVEFARFNLSRAPGEINS